MGERKRVSASRPARIDVPMGPLAGRVIAEIRRRRQASNKPAKRTSKKVAGASERWPSSARFSGSSGAVGRVNRRPEAREMAAKGHVPCRGSRVVP